MKANKYDLYERSVQTPKSQVTIFQDIYKELNSKKPISFREDFCGTFTISVAWIKADSRHSALALDLDPEPLAYGKKHHLSKLSPHEKKRLKIRKQNVRTVTEKCDIIGACNFSFFTFQDRYSLVDYFKCCRKSLKKNGVLILEMAGGPGMIERTSEQTTVRVSGGKKFRFIWDQKNFNPISRNGKYAIHFKFSDGTLLKNAFTYDWRVWTIPEVRDALKDAGFRETAVFWDSEYSNNRSAYTRTEKLRNDHAWHVQVVGLA